LAKLASVPVPPEKMHSEDKKKVMDDTVVLAMDQPTNTGVS